MEVWRMLIYFFQRTLILGILLLSLLPSKLHAFSLHFLTYYYYFNNADFQSYDKKKYEENQAFGFKNTDDSIHFLYASLRLRYIASYKKTNFFVDLEKSGYWGGNNLQGADQGLNPLRFNRLYFEYIPFSFFQLTLGRFRYRIGDSRNDYFFSSVIDGIEGLFSFKEIFRFSVVSDLLSNAVQAEGAGIYSITAKDEEKIEDFQGDTLSWRVGLRSGVTLPYSLGIKSFFYYLRYGASFQGGADLSENGKNSLNEGDGDYLFIGGLRFFRKQLERFSCDATWAYSKGVDFQFDRKYNYQGNAATINFDWNWERIPFKNEIGFSNGYFQEGYAGMRAQSMGGVLLWGYKSYYPSPFAATYHFRDYNKQSSSQYEDRTNAKIFVKISEKFSFSKNLLSFQTLFLWETKSREYMGTEVEIQWIHTIDNIQFRSTAAIFHPSSYYSTRALDNPFFPSGKNTFYGFYIRIEYLLDLMSQEVQNKTQRRFRNKNEEIEP